MSSAWMKWDRLGLLPMLAQIAPDYGGHDAPVWVFGSLEPSTGAVITQMQTHRTRHEFIALLDQVVQTWSQGELVLILDNLAVHKPLDVQLWALAHPQVRFLFQPTYAPWLNLIEPWWKTLRALALKGRAFTQSDQLTTALTQATAYWNDHRHPYVWHQAA